MGSVEWHPGPDVEDDTPESRDDGRSGLFAEWDDGTGGDDITHEDLLATAGLELASGASAD
ncbi:hypothetical protein ACFFTQ_22070 [Streptomyces roseofulvus]|uniref:hypothetical protein n=1 Tax=Streptomyces roseofulvus TaxID=33902 RepID=UPI0031FDFEDD